MKQTLAAIALLALGACATHAEGPTGPPSLDVSANIAAPPQADYYANCIAQSTAAHTYFREERVATLLRFNCDGAVAQRFFDGLGPRSAEVGSELVVGERTWRFTNPIQRDTVGLDYCWRDALAGGPADYQCTVVLNVGEFLERQ